jgi:lambda family phage minor tail protein L
MSNVIATDVQTQEIDSALIELFEITLPNGTTLYFHPGLDSDLTDVQFRDKTSPYAIRDYNPMPMMIDGLSLQADGASSRPAFTVANIGTLFQTELGDFKNDDLIGERLIRRQTLRKYLVGGTEDASPPIEFPSQEYIIDRIAEENSTSITYEVATPFDLENIQLPRRIVVGKYCSWKYQGHASGEGGGCTWNTDGAVNYNGDGTTRAHKAYFDFDDRPLVAAETFAAYSASTAYTTVSYVTTNTPTVSAGAFVVGLDYTIVSTGSGSTNFTSIGAANNTVGTVFRATGVGSGTGTATLTQYWVCTIAGTGNTPSVTSAYWKEVRKWTEWASGTTYQIGTLVRYNAVTIWKARIISTGQIPTDTSPYWVREEICGKTLQSCKARYGFKPSVLTSANQKPEGSTNLAARLPFGSFPGTLKY